MSEWSRLLDAIEQRLKAGEKLTIAQIAKEYNYSPHKVYANLEGDIRFELIVNNIEIRLTDPEVIK